MLSLAEKTKAKIMSHAETLEGDLYIGAGETMGVHYLTQVVSNPHKRFPGIRLRMSSGDSLDLANQLDSELLDFALLFSPIDPLKYNMLQFPTKAPGDSSCGRMIRLQAKNVSRLQI